MHRVLGVSLLLVLLCYVLPGKSTAPGVTQHSGIPRSPARSMLNRENVCGVRLRVHLDEAREVGRDHFAEDRLAPGAQSKGQEQRLTGSREAGAEAVWQL